MLDKQIIKNFFSGQNNLKWDVILNSNQSNFFAFFINKHMTTYQVEGHPIMLPMMYHNGDVDFYIGFNIISNNKFLHQDLISFFSDYYGSFSNLPNDLDIKIDHEHLLENFFKGPSYKISSSKHDEQNQILSKFEDYFKVLFRKPKLIKKYKRPVAQIRKDFDSSILLGDIDNSEKYKIELIKTGRFDPESEIFFNIRMLSGLGHWQSININNLKMIKGMRLPPKIITDISNYFLNICIVPFLDSERIDECIDFLDAYNFGDFLNYFCQKKTSSNFGNLICLVFTQLYFEKRKDSRLDLTLYHQLIKHLKEFNDKKLIHAFVIKNNVINGDRVQLRTLTSEDDLLIEYNELYETERYEDALELLNQFEVNHRSIVRMMKCIIDYNVYEKDINKSSNILDEFFNKFNLLSSVDKEKINNSIRDFKNLSLIYQLKKKILNNEINPIPKNWIEFINFILNDKDCDFKNFFDTDFTFISEIKNKIFINNNLKIIEFSNLIVNELSDNQLDRSFNFLYEHFVTDEFTNSQNLIDVQIRLLQHLLLNENLPNNFEGFCLDIQDAILDKKPSKKQYILLIDNLIILKDHMGFNDICFMIDLLEKFILHACPSIDKLKELFSNFIDKIYFHQRRLNEVHKLCLTNLFIDFKYPMPNWLKVHDETKNKYENNRFEHLSNKSVGICTLSESAGKRVVDLINKEIPSCKITLNSDKECTRSLESLSKNADIFIFAWKSSKHPAFDCIQKYRQKDLPLLFASGKGSASIIEKLTEL